MINDLQDLIYKYYDNTIDEALISTDEDGRIPVGGKYVFESTEDAFTYAYFIDPDVVAFKDIMKQFPNAIDINDLIFRFLKKLSDNLAERKPFDQIILIADNFIDFLNFFGFPVKNEELQDSLISICNGNEDTVQKALLKFHSDTNEDGQAINRLSDMMRQALDEQSKIEATPFDPTGYDGEEFYYVTDKSIRDDDYEYQERYPELEPGSNFLPMQQTEDPFPFSAPQTEDPMDFTFAQKNPFSFDDPMGPTQQDPSVFRFAPQTQENPMFSRGLDLPRSMSDNTGRKLDFDDEENINRNPKKSRSANSSPRDFPSSFPPSFSFNPFAGGKRTRKYRRKPKKTLKRRKNKKTRKPKRKIRKTLKKKRKNH